MNPSVRFLYYLVNSGTYSQFLMKKLCKNEKNQVSFVSSGFIEITFYVTLTTYDTYASLEYNVLCTPP